MDPENRLFIPADLDRSRSSSSIDASELRADEFSEKGDLNRHYKRKSLCSRFIGALKWPFVFISYTFLLLYVQRTFLSPSAMGKVPGGDANGLVPEFEFETRPFRTMTDLYSVNYTSELASLEVRERWRQLFPKGNGQVAVEHPEGSPYLLHPLTSKLGKTGYFLSWVHQLHCLYVIMDLFDQVVQFGLDGKEQFSHVAHCEDYLRQAILCNLDQTLEGTVEWGGVPNGMNNTHVCRSYDKSRAWAETMRQSDEITIGFEERYDRIGNHGLRPGSTDPTK